MANNSNANPFVLSSVIEHLKMNASKKELGLLRQVSTGYNISMSKKYFDELNKTICLKTPNDLNREDLLLEIKLNSFPILSCDEPVVFKSLTTSTWDPTIAHMFRKLHIRNCSDCNEHKNKQKVPISEIISELQNLKLIVFEMTVNGVHGFRSLDVPMKIIENLPNPSTTIVFECYTTRKTHYEELSSWIDSLKLVKNPIFFDFDLDLYVLNDSFEDFEEFTTLFLKHIKKIRNLSLEITFLPHLHHGRPDPDPLPFKTKIYSLSPYLTKLHVNIKNKQATFRDFINAGSSFPKLKRLVMGKNHYQNLEFLKSCPVLEELVMKIHQDSIFSNPEISDEENIERCFGHLNRLNMKSFLLWYKKDDKIQAGNELCSYLKSILPVNIRFEMVEGGDFDFW